MIKTTQLEKITIIKYKIQFEDGIVCYYTISNGVMTDYNFENIKKDKLKLILHENIEKLKTQHWNTHRNLIYKLENVEQLKNYTKFGELYYIGSSLDGMVKDKNGNFISSIVKFNDVFSQTCLEIETTKNECLNILNNLNSKYIVEYNIVEIPYYNQNDKKSYHYTLSLDILLTNNTYRRLLGDNKFIDDNIKMKIFKFLKKK